MATGTLYVVATPIGNLEDVTTRALRILREVDVIACEDTRHTRVLLQRYGITTPLVSYHEHNEQTRAQELLRRLQEGTSVALGSDAGTPVLSDPGFTLVRQAVAAGGPIVPAPGASARTAGLCVPGLAPARFVFLGIFPGKAGGAAPALLRGLLRSGVPVKDAVRQVAQAHRLPRRAVYEMALVLQGKRQRGT